MTSINPSTDSKIRCRFAPSPTGNLHVGGARTALFNYLFAKNTGGTYVLRIEDTDVARSTQEAVDSIFAALDWLGLVADEGPYFQSKRSEIYHKAAKELLAKGHAYRCYCSEEELTAMREEQKQNNQKPQYNRKYRPAEITAQPIELPTGKEETPFVIRIRAPLDGTTSFDDLILGRIDTPSEELDDFVIVRSDGTPTYNFVVVVDDIDMQISHVIRGLDHVSNTPKQVIIYEALGATLPKFAHVPMILGPDKKKLSKRHGATSVFEYKSEGYLADAFVNYLARLGWSHGDQEIFTRKQLEEHFSIDHIGKSAAVFDTAKLIWVNSEHLKVAPIETLAPIVREFLKETGANIDDLTNDNNFLKLVESLKIRSKTLVELAQGCEFYLKRNDQLNIAAELKEKHLTEAIKPAISSLITELEKLTDFSETNLEQCFARVVEAQQIKLGKLAQPVRVAVTGSTISPPIYTVLELLGKATTLNRLTQALS
jgi:glutamyl-tRNA synthetase